MSEEHDQVNFKAATRVWVLSLKVGSHVKCMDPQSMLGFCACINMCLSRAARTCPSLWQLTSRPHGKHQGNQQERLNLYCIAWFPGTLKSINAWQVFGSRSAFLSRTKKALSQNVDFLVGTVKRKAS